MNISNELPIVPATFLRRLGAIIYDCLLLSALLMVASLPAVMLAGGADSSFIKGPGYQLYLYGISFLFFGWFWVHGGQTLGMRSWKLRVIRDDGDALRWGNALIRFVGATVSLFTLGMGFLWILCNRKRLAWHDLASKTRIIYSQPRQKTP